MPTNAIVLTDASMIIEKKFLSPLLQCNAWTDLLNVSVYITSCSNELHGDIPGCVCEWIGQTASIRSSRAFNAGSLPKFNAIIFENENGKVVVSKFVLQQDEFWVVQ